MAVLAVLVAGGCTEPAPRVPIGSAEVIGAASALAGVPRDVVLRVRGADDAPLAGMRVRWTAAANAGTLDSVFTHTNTEGHARVRWTPPTAAGSYALSALVDGRLDVEIPAIVSGGYPARVELSADSVRLTRVGPRRVRLRAFDQYENPTQNTLLAASASGPIHALIGLDSLGIGSTATAARGTGEIVLRSADPGVDAPPVLARVKVVVDIQIMSVELVGIDSANGLAVGESLPFTIVAKDSGGITVTANPGDAGVSVASADPAIVSVDADGILTGLQAGSTTVTATINGTSLSTHVDVVPAYDFGALDTLYQMPQRTLHTYHEGPMFAPTGRSVFFWQQTSSCCPKTTTVTWYRPDGGTATTKEYSGWRKTTASPTGLFMLSNPLTAYDSVGTELWTRPVSGDVRADSTLVVAYTSTAIVGFSATGDSLWSFTPTVAFNFPALLAPKRVYLPRDAGNALEALDRAGNHLWDRPIASARPLVTDEASRIFYGNSQSVFAIDSTGADLWNVSVPSAFLPLHALGQGDALVVWGSGVLRVLDRTTGHTRWTVDIPSAISLTTAGNRVLIANSYVHVLDLATGQRLGRSRTRHASINKLTCTAAGLAFEGGLPAMEVTGALRYARCQ